MSDWTRCSSSNPCPICGAKKWCSVTPSGDGVVCMKEASDHPTRNGGWWHPLDGYAVARPRIYKPAPAPAGPTRTPAPPATPEDAADPPAPDADRWHRIAAGCFHREEAPAKRLELSAKLGVTAASLERIGCGWSKTCCCWTFPERDGRGNIIGVNRRYADGSQRAAKGSNRGLTYDADQWPPVCDRLFLVEGASDTSAALSVGLAAVGRPSNVGGVSYLIDLLRPLPTDCKIIVVAERDLKANGHWPGRDGAVQTAAALARGLFHQVGWRFPPGDCKDMREWLCTR